MSINVPSSSTEPAAEVKLPDANLAAAGAWQTVCSSRGLFVEYQPVMKEDLKGHSGSSESFKSISEK